jgi:hypothetical protein
LVRAKPIRDSFKEILNHDGARKNFLSDVFLFKPNVSIQRYEAQLKMLPVENRVNYILDDLVITYAKRFLVGFKPVILQAPPGSHFISADVPVFVNWRETQGQLLSPQTEIYFPISPEFCLFLSCDKSTKTLNHHRNYPAFKPKMIHTLQINLLNNELMLECFEGIIVHPTNAAALGKNIQTEKAQKRRKERWQRINPRNWFRLSR